MLATGAAAGSAVGTGAAAGAVDDAADPAQLLSESVTVCSNWALMTSPWVVPYLLTRAALTWAVDKLAPDAGSIDTAAIAFPNDMSRSKYPMMHESWLSLPLPPPAAVNWLTSALVHWPGAAPWAGGLGSRRRTP